MHTQPRLSHPTRTRAHTCHEVCAHRDANTRCTLVHAHSHCRHSHSSTHSYLDTQMPAQSHTQVNAHTTIPTYTEAQGHSYHHARSSTNTKTVWVHTGCSHSTRTPVRRLFLMRWPKSPGHSRHMRCLVLTLPQGWAVPPTAGGVAQPPPGWAAVSDFGKSRNGKREGNAV